MRAILFFLAAAVVLAVVAHSRALADEQKSASSARPTKPTPAGAEFFEKQIRPVLVKHCYSCHSAEAKTLEGGLLLDSRSGLLKGGDNGPIIVPGEPAKSRLLHAISHTDENLQMPPEERLPAEVVKQFEQWIKMGAPDPREQGPTVSPVRRLDLETARDFWSFRPIVNRPPPDVANASWPRADIDRFILAALEAKELAPVADADKRTLIRRATYDLTGLPPTLEEIDAFLADETQDALARVVDRLLDSPHYGERWGRHWLDVVRYADTAGDNSDYPIPQMYKYRNWVIEAFNKDKPYDAFVREQLAGDLLPSDSEPERYQKLIATGYLANARRFGSYEDDRYQWYLTIEDTIDNLGRTFLGLSIHCARCHDHKFDPIGNEDYYALYGFFQSTRYPWPGIELVKYQRDLVPLAPPAEVEAALAKRKGEMTALDAKIKELEAEQKAAQEARKDAEKVENDDERKTKIAEAKKRLDEIKQAITAKRNERDRLEKALLPIEHAYAVAEGDNKGKQKVGNARVQLKGDPERIGPEVPRRFPTVLGGQSISPEEKGSGRRELAGWITDPANPLTARVMVNRIWHYHFGKGISQTPSDFGLQGRRPTHPELLDFLAARFIENGWSIKAMHRLIMLSRTYQLASHDDETNSRVDIANDYLWRFNRQRLDAESIRDSILSVSGSLDRSTGGPHPFPEQPSWNFTQHNPFKAVYDTNRRSVYLMTQRIQRHPFLALFDGADTNTSTACRLTSTTSLQALYLMNDPFIHDQARKFATRLLSERSDEPARVELAYQLMFARPADADEQSAAAQYLAQVRQSVASQGVSTDEQTIKSWESLIRAMWMSNEFVYVN
jgi:hypothetical protein